ncbi:MAG TPA: Sec-independent protein translocase protein TatB [Gallionellaceae bacterium]|nr:Sec-independent protein translocase protein TatB [Gallionellaceae bacterium]
MFGIDFSELVVIMVVAVIVIGPEHLPKVARTAGLLWSRLQRYVNGIKSDIAREMEVDELRKMQQQTQAEVSQLEQSVQQAGQEMAQAAPLQQTHEIIEEMERELHDGSGQQPNQKNK